MHRRYVAYEPETRDWFEIEVLSDRTCRYYNNRTRNMNPSRDWMAHTLRVARRTGYIIRRTEYQY